VTAAEQSRAAVKQSLELAKLTAELGRQSLEAVGQSRDYAQKQLDKATLSAPFAGTIASLPVDEGDTVLGTTTIAHLIEPGKMELKVQVDEIDIPGVKTGQRVIIKVDALPEMTLDGKVSYISLLPKKEAGVTLFDVKIRLDAAEGSGLRGGMSASADIVTDERSNVLLVPNRVVKQNSQGNSIVEVSASGQIQERTVVTGISDGFQIEIVSGLKEGETLVENRAR
jgi:HlyD family secretion protein